MEVLITGGAGYIGSHIALNLLDAGYEVFLWPKKLGTLYKDLNDVVMALKTNRMPSTFIDEHSYKGLKGRVILSQIN